MSLFSLYRTWPRVENGRIASFGYVMRTKLQTLTASAVRPQVEGLHLDPDMLEKLRALGYMK